MTLEFLFPYTATLPLYSRLPMTGNETTFPVTGTPGSVSVGVDTVRSTTVKVHSSSLTLYSVSSLGSESTDSQYFSCDRSQEVLSLSQCPKRPQTSFCPGRHSGFLHIPLTGYRISRSPRPTSRSTINLTDFPLRPFRV